NDKRMWMYNMNAIKHLQPEINKLTDMYISKNHSKDFNDFSNNINKNIEVYKKIYGNSRAIDYKNNVYKDMYTRMGNSILTEMKKFDSEKNNISNINFKKKRNKLQSKYAIRKEMQNSVYHLDRYMNDNLQNIKNQNEHEQLQKERRFTISEHTFDYLEDYAYKNNIPYASISTALENIVDEHKNQDENEFKLNHVIDKISDEVVKSVQIEFKKSISNEINKVRLGTNNVDRNTQILIELLQGYMQSRNVNHILSTDDNFPPFLEKTNQLIKERITVQKQKKDSKNRRKEGIK